MHDRRLAQLASTAIAIVGVGCGDATENTTTTVPTAPLSADSTSSTSGAAQTGDVTVQVFFTPTRAVQTDCSVTAPVNRTVQGPDVLANTLTQLLAGPNAEERDAGLQSWFSADTADSLRSADIVDGTAYIDFEDFRIMLSAATSSCGSAIFLNQLDRTLGQFPTIERTLYSFEGDVKAFYEWIQMGSPPDYYTPPPSTTS
jgi:spore germination protein GerM